MSRHGATLTRPSAPLRETAAVLPSSPWSVRGRRQVVLVAVVTGLVLVLAWYGCAGETTWRVQVRWFGLGVAACAVNAVGCLVWLATGVRALRRERAWTLAALRQRQPVRAPEGDAELDSRPAALVTAARMRRYHRDDCPLMRGKLPLPVTPDLDPCGVCAS